MEHFTIIAYCTYLVISIVLTIWVAKTLFTNGRVFLLEIFRGNEELTDAVNRLLLVGFYLINVGYILFTMTVTDNLYSTQSVLELLSRKIGIVILVLGFMHFFNMYILFRGKKKSRENQLRDQLLNSDK
jgi:hypothetical protein